MPFDRIFYFDYIEKNDIFVPGGLAPVSNLPDELSKRGINYHISNWRRSEQDNINALLDDVKRGEITFAFLYTAALDGLLHMHDRHSKIIREKLEWYEDQLLNLVAEVEKHYDSYTLNVMSDHGMTPLAGTVDVKSQIGAIGLKFGKDYVATYDSTLGRFWPFNAQAEDQILGALRNVPHSSICIRRGQAEIRDRFP